MLLEPRCRFAACLLSQTLQFPQDGVLVQGAWHCLFNHGPRHLGKSVLLKCPGKAPAQTQSYAGKPKVGA